MPHARQQIRDAVATAVTGLATTGANVFKTRIYRLEQQTLPALLVYTLSEDSARETMTAPQAIGRTLRVAIEAAVEQTANIDAKLDDIAAEIETAIANNTALQALVRAITLDSTAITMSGEGEQRALGMVLTYSAYYRTREGSPSTIIA